ncbi:MAG: tRNA1(Val) (adenine(37)-N6)-methyltransferase [Firmicutes bacterium]|nr:tRNA1(Val) (adenine(37)-N6)-methyltransferase [Bacillota bacterium]
MAVRADDTGFGGLILLQDPETFCYGVDAVLLADYCKASSSEVLLDLGSGNGAASLIAMGKYSPASVTGIEVQEAQVQLARESAKRNGLEDRLRFLHGDVKDIQKLAEASSFDAVLCNPPYGEAGRGPVSESSAAFIARHETTASLLDFVQAAAYALKPGGRFVIVHRPSRLPDIFEACRACGLEPKRMRLVLPRPGAAPNIVLVSASKGGGKELTVDPSLCVRGEDGAYSEELQRIYGRI